MCRGNLGSAQPHGQLLLRISWPISIIGVVPTDCGIPIGRQVVFYVCGATVAARDQSGLEHLLQRDPSPLVVAVADRSDQKPAFRRTGKNVPLGIRQLANRPIIRLIAHDFGLRPRFCPGLRPRPILTARSRRVSA